GAYYVVVTDVNGCKATSNSVELSVTGLEALSYDDFTIFPNPVTNGNWNLMAGKAWLGAKVKVYNAAGQLVFETEVKDNKTEIGFDAAQGMYLLEMKLNKKKVEEKLIKL
ncbi:MAG: T9SS type A sorting domain-containing protein, partial [Bacteroidetes bacterium]|nr:T9SS type A sorting domain-containing protein [Bacteroidota bacterium]